MAQYLVRLLINLLKQLKHLLMKKNVFKLTFALAAGLMLFSCGNNAGTGNDAADSTAMDKKMANDSDAVKDNSTNNNDFVSKAATGGMMEVALGKLAQTNGSSKDVKDFGKMMETDHSAANAKLKDVAFTENISIPAAMTDEQNRHISNLQTKTGAEFDKEYISMMVDDHVKDIDEFKKASESNSNAKVKEFAAATLPTLQGHLDKAKAIKDKLK
jgi:putative membrane protein